MSAASLEGVLGLLAIGIHLALLVDVPRGMYLDECAIGHAGRLLATSGHDEHGVDWPLYPKSLGDYKNPPFVYLVVLTFKLVGFSEWATRFPSFMCWLFGTMALYALGRRIWQDRWVRLYLLACLSFTPWIFSLSRVSFELIALYPLIGIYLYATYRAFEENSIVWVAPAGFALGSCVYAYSTFRLLAPLHVVTTLLCYVQRPYWRRAAMFALCAAVAATPFAVYIATNPDHLTVRFKDVTYLYDPKLSFADKLELFCDHYLGYFSRAF